MEHTHPATRDNDQSAKLARRFSPDETQDYYEGDLDDEPEMPERFIEGVHGFCVLHGYQDTCEGEVY